MFFFYSSYWYFPLTYLSLTPFFCFSIKIWSTMRFTPSRQILSYTSYSSLQIKRLFRQVTKHPDQESRISTSFPTLGFDLSLLRYTLTLQQYFINRYWYETSKKSLLLHLCFYEVLWTHVFVWARWLNSLKKKSTHHKFISLCNLCVIFKSIEFVLMWYSAGITLYSKGSTREY